MLNDPIINGKIKLDFDAYDYLYALSSRRCECPDKGIAGFEFID